MSELLEQVIEVWKAKLLKTHPSRIEMGSGACPFCKVFFANSCRDCPISERTGLGNCKGTPYEKTLMAFYDWRLNPDILSYRTAFRQAVGEELKFLRSLRKPSPQSTSETLAS